jgi:hypothetical protein
MKITRDILSGLLMVATLTAAACGDDDNSVQDAGTDADSDTDSDSDSDSDADTDADSDSDTDSDADSDADSDSDADTDADSDADADSDTDSDTDADSDTDSDTDTDVDTGEGIGSACTCEGSGCEQALVHVPIPNGGTIVGCDDVPSDVSGTELVCLRSYEGSYATNTYFANGYCALMSTLCDGDATICDSAVFGVYADMDECPPGSVKLTSSQDVEVELIPGVTLQATIDNQICAASCQGEGDCREDENDPVLGAPTQYACIDKEGVKFCYDPRDLPETYTAEQF